MSELDVASTVGTWVGAGIGVLALIGIVGPLIVYLASLTDRNKALARLDSGLASNGGFITSGVPFGRNIRLLRRVRAPDLSKPPLLPPGWKPSWQSTVVLPHKDSADWVQLGVALQACGLKYSQGDALVFHERTAALPVSRTWLAILGLVGRFGIRSHDGRWPTNLSTGLKFHQPQADEGLYEVARWATRNKFPRGAFDDSEFSNDPEDWWTSHEDFRPGDRLEGVFGTLRFSSRKKRVHFAAYYQTDIGGLSEEILDAAGLLWLSVGCLPSRDGKVFCLDDVQLPVEAAEDEEEGDPQLTAEHEYNIGVQSRIPRDRIDEKPFARGLRRTRPSRGSDVRRDIDPAAERLGSGALNLASSLAVARRFHFTPTNHQHNDGIGRRGD